MIGGFSSKEDGNDEWRMFLSMMMLDEYEDRSSLVWRREWMIDGIIFGKEKVDEKATGGIVLLLFRPAGEIGNLAISI